MQSAQFRKKTLPLRSKTRKLCQTYSRRTVKITFFHLFL